MKRLMMLAAVAAAAIGLGAAVATAQESPTPQPAGTATPNLCTGIPVRGGETVAVGSENEVTLPGGVDFTIQGVAPPPDVGFIVCYVDGNARVTMSRTCSEIRRENPDDDPGADFVLDLIVDSCERTAPTPTATTPSQGSDDDDLVTVTPTPSGGTISPPSTGDAGLK